MVHGKRSALMFPSSFELLIQTEIVLFMVALRFLGSEPKSPIPTLFWASGGMSGLHDNVGAAIA